MQAVQGVAEDHHVAVPEEDEVAPGVMIAVAVLAGRVAHFLEGEALRGESEVCAHAGEISPDVARCRAEVLFLKERRIFSFQRSINGACREPACLWRPVRVLRAVEQLVFRVGTVVPEEGVQVEHAQARVFEELKVFGRGLASFQSLREAFRVDAHLGGHWDNEQVDIKGPQALLDVEQGREGAHPGAGALLPGLFPEAARAGMLQFVREEKPALSLSLDRTARQLRGLRGEGPGHRRRRPGRGVVVEDELPFTNAVHDPAGFQAGVIDEAVKFQSFDGIHLGGECGQGGPIPDRPLGNDDLPSPEGSKMHLLYLVKIGGKAARVGPHLAGGRCGCEPHEPAIQFQRLSLQKGCSGQEKKHESRCRRHGTGWMPTCVLSMRGLPAVKRITPESDGTERELAALSFRECPPSRG